MLWYHWWNLVCDLRPACARTRTFLWMSLCLAGFSTRKDLLGVTSIVRALGLEPACYDRLLDFFHSPAGEKLIGLQVPDRRLDFLGSTARTLERVIGLAQTVAQTLRDVTKLRGEVTLAAPGSLPNDGKVIEDARRYD